MSEEFADIDQMAYEAEKALTLERFRRANRERAQYVLKACISEDPSANPNDKEGLQILEKIDNIGAELVQLNKHISHTEHPAYER